MPIHLRKSLWLAICLAGTANGAVDTAALVRCREIRDPTARLACYDAVVASAPASAASAAAQAPTVVDERAATVAAFGLEHRAAGAPQLEAIESMIQGPFDGWVAGQRIRLANGQLWQISDGSEAGYNLRDPKVKVSRGLAGSFFMEIEGVSQTPRVRRLR